MTDVSAPYGVAACRYVSTKANCVPTLNPGSLSLFSSLVVERETLVGPDHVTTQNLGGKKIGWERGVAKSRDCYCHNFTVSGREGKKCGVS